MSDARQGRAEHAPFAARYAEWRRYIRNAPECAFASDDAVFTNNEAFRAIIALGPSAIPAIVEQLFRDPDAQFLCHALAELAGDVFTPEDYAAAAQLFGSPLGSEASCAMWKGWWLKHRRRLKREETR